MSRKTCRDAFDAWEKSAKWDQIAPDDFIHKDLFECWQAAWQARDTATKEAPDIEALMDEMRRWENDGWVHLDDIEDVLRGKPLTLQPVTK